MIPVTSCANKKIAVFGLGLSGLATVRALLAGGASVVTWDDGENGRESAGKEGFSVVDLREADWSDFDAFILSPGVPLTHPKPHWTVEKAKTAGVEVIGDTELFFREFRAQNSKAKLIGITGTNGKSTTTALVAHILASAGIKMRMGGNIGRAVLDLEPFSDDAVYVLELSSYQIDLTPTLLLDAAALLNITPDHIDRHGTVEHYAEVKSRIFSHLKSGQTAVIGVDDDYCCQISSHLTGEFEKVEISVEAPVTNGVYGTDSTLFLMKTGKSTGEVSLKGIPTLRGAHNWQNAACAYALVRSVGVSHEDCVGGLKTFSGLEHRMQPIAEIGRVHFVNDSKGTNADAAEKALSAFKNIYWIAGGVAKEGGIEPLRPLFDHITKAYLIGEAAEDFAMTLGSAVPFHLSGTIDQAVRDAFADAQKDQRSEEPVILLSPACASFDQFPNFMKRGEAFCAAVEKLKG